MPIELGCRGYASRALIAYLRGIGLSASELKKKTKELEAAAESALTAAGGASVGPSTLLW